MQLNVILEEDTYYMLKGLGVITGDVVGKFGKKYFVADENQEGLDLFMSTEQIDVMIPYEIKRMS